MDSKHTRWNRLFLRQVAHPPKKTTIRDSKRWLWLSKGSMSFPRVHVQIPCQFSKMYTPWKFNIAPENGWLEDYFPAYLHLFARAMLHVQSVYLKCWLLYTMIFQLIWWCEVCQFSDPQTNLQGTKDGFISGIHRTPKKKSTHQTTLAESLSVTRIPKPGFCCCIVWGGWPP